MQPAISVLFFDMLLYVCAGDEGDLPEKVL